jgi:hypothetical protein
MRSVVFAVTALFVSAGSVHAQAARATDARFYPFVGCWRADSAAATDPTLSCVVPVPGSADVEIVALSDGRVVDRHRLDASGRPRVIDDEGCRGQEQTSSSTLPRRVYLHAELICEPNGAAGGRTTLLSILPTGEWLEVESVRSGAGVITHAQRRRDAGLPASVPRELAARLGRQRLAVMTSRAEAAAPLRPSDVVEALRHTDSSVVREWLLATAQPFQLTGDEVAALVKANVPAPVLQAMMATGPAYQLGVGADASGRSTDAYLSTPGVAGGTTPTMTTMARVPYENVYGGQGCCVQPAPVYQSYDYYTPVPGFTYYSLPYVSYYSPYNRGRYPYSYQRGGYGPRRQAPAPSYHSNPVGVRAGQTVASPPRGVPSRRRP